MNFPDQPVVWREISLITSALRNDSQDKQTQFLRSKNEVIMMYKLPFLEYHILCSNFPQKGHICVIGTLVYVLFLATQACTKDATWTLERLLRTLYNSLKDVDLSLCLGN